MDGRKGPDIEKAVAQTRAAFTALKGIHEKTKRGQVEIDELLITFGFVMGCTESTLDALDALADEDRVKPIHTFKVM